MVSRKRWAPILEEANKTTFSDHLGDLILHKVGDTLAIQDRRKNHMGIVEDESAGDPDFQLLAPLLEFPAINSARAGQAEIDTNMFRRTK